MSDFMERQKKIEKTVVDGYKKMEDTVVSGYQKVEDAFVGGYQKIEDSFVNKFMAPTEETSPEEKAADETPLQDNEGE